MTATLTRQHHTELARKYYQTCKAMDLNTALNMLDPKVELQHFTPVMSMSGMRHGRDQVRAYYEAMQHEAEMLHMTPRTFLEDGDTVVVLGDYHLRVRQNHKELKATWVHVLKFRNDKIVSLKAYSEADRVIQAFS